MIQSFADPGTEDVFNGRDTRPARRACPAQLWAVARRKLDQLDATVSLEALRVPPGNRRGQHSIRINDRFRVCFVWAEAGPASVETVDYH